MKTRNGTPFRIYAADGMPPFPLHGAILLDEGWISYEWTAEGFRNRDREPHDLDIDHAMPVVLPRQIMKFGLGVN